MIPKTYIEELKLLDGKWEIFGKYNLENRRYIGSKSKLLPWISQLIDEHTKGSSFFDVFSGTGIIKSRRTLNFLFI